nr:hypothetical protein [Tanacetum cinerariifolium]
RPPPPPPPPLPPTHQQPRPPKIFLPTFDGSNPLDWIFQADNYFTYYAIPPDQRLSLSVFYFTGDALSWAEGLCFRCPEKYHPGHVCTPPQFLLIAGNECESESDVIPDLGFFHIEDTSSEHTEIPTVNELQTPHFLALSDAAYFGLKSPRAVRVTGYIQGQPVTVLVDCGSTHTIIQPRIASSLTDILKQSSFTWNVSASEAFNNLKQAMSQLLTLALQLVPSSHKKISQFRF